jgi:predicted HAD superfamily Cof-like phosphohydrolase
VSVGDGPRTGDETRQVDQDAPFLPDASAASGLEDAGRVRAPERGSQPGRDAHSGSSSWAAVEALATLLEPEAFDPDVPAADEWRERAKDTALGYAAKTITAGYRRVVEDDTTAAGMVREFHKAFGVAIDQDATADLRKLRADLVTEECEEARFALIAEDLHAIAKELADVVIVAYGSAVSLGIDLDKAVALVHASNMSKLGEDGKPVLRADGKVLKGSNYRPPDMRAAVRALREDT